MTETVTQGDPYVYNVQRWLNNTYQGYTSSGRYEEVVENGKVTWDTIYGLIRALQIELGIQETADNFGSGTESAFCNQYPNGIHQQDDDDDSEKNIYGIIQGALLCKGYSTGVNTPTLHFYNGTGSAIKELKADAGIDNSSSTVTLNIMKALLSMDYFYSYDNSEKVRNIQTIQRYLNRNYEDYIGLQPCDGIYGRGTNTALIYAIQAEGGLPISVANGNFGPTTKACCPTIPYTGVETDYYYNVFSNDSIKRFTKLINMGLYVNGFGDGTFSDTINETLLRLFQNKYAIPETGICDITTWMSLFVSCGDINRSAIACDCATIINNDNVSVLINNNYEYIGRYLSGTTVDGTSKALSTGELKILFQNGIRLFPIFQGDATYIDYFNENQAIEDATDAVNYANNLNLQFGSIIYFAVDFDAMDVQITNSIIPYFAKLYETFMTSSGGKYRVGVYGTRNLCSRVCSSGYAVSSFVSDMSTGFSGNLGFSIPDNWALDQFDTITISSNGQSIEIDKDGFSGNYMGISQEYYDVEHNELDNSILENGNTVRLLINTTGSSIPVYKTKGILYTPLGSTYKKVDGPIIGYINPNDFYMRYALQNQSNDNIHRVMFNDGTDVKIGYIEEKTNYVTLNPYSDAAIRAQILDGQDDFTGYEYDPSDDTYIFHQYDEQSARYFYINKPVPYFNTSGVYQGMLQKGDYIKIVTEDLSTPGYTKPWCLYVDMIKKNGNSEYEAFGNYVSVGIEYASSGSERAWY